MQAADKRAADKNIPASWLHLFFSDIVAGKIIPPEILVYFRNFAVSDFTGLQKQISAKSPDS